MLKRMILLVLLALPVATLTACGDAPDVEDAEVEVDD